MAIPVVCICGATYQVKDEYAGKRLKCPKCGQIVQAPMADSVGSPLAASASTAAPPPLPASVSPAGYETVAVQQSQAIPLGYAAPPMEAVGNPFARDRFLLRQKHFSISQKYYVWDEQGRVIFFIERPAHVLRNLGAALAAVVSGLVLGGGLAVLLAFLAEGNDGLQIGLVIFGVVVGFAAALVIGVALSAKRHVTFYSDDMKSQALLEVIQENKWQVINALYTIRTPEGEVLARLRKNYLFNIIRKRWYVYGPDGVAMLAVAKEDSIILSLLRRVLGDVAWLIRTNFVILQGETDRVIGEFNRKFTILDRYVLDMTADRARELDRRVALAIGVMLDTGERR